MESRYSSVRGMGYATFLGQREKHPCAERGVGWLNAAIAGVLVQLGFEGFVIGRVHPIDPVTQGDCIGHQIDPVVCGSGGWEALRKVLGEGAGEARV